MWRHRAQAVPKACSLNICRPQPDIEPTQRIDGDVIAPVNDDGCCLSLNDRRTFQEVARPQTRKSIDRNFTPLTEEGLSTSDRSASRRQWHRSLFLLWTGHCSDRGDTRVDKNHFLVGGRISVEFLVATVKPLFHLDDQRRRAKIDIAQRHVNLENLLAVAHLGRAFDRDRTVKPCSETIGCLTFEVLKD